jgi:hypothetical protein
MLSRCLDLGESRVDHGRGSRPRARRAVALDMTAVAKGSCPSTIGTAALTRDDERPRDGPTPRVNGVVADVLGGHRGRATKALAAARAVARP